MMTRTDDVQTLPLVGRVGRRPGWGYPTLRLRVWHPTRPAKLAGHPPHREDAGGGKEARFC